ncbi:hypothetical protein TrCOL_g7933 [Triparma columacea]|uniref:Protein ENHANCED DISEASE RESISTANCE 2 C-terminal domain-containing protein n=1 Tax=Triparma columacea TaxID=722753 RepID=A0A9W7L2P3_9STRA|nr:hypothetical protein TrCOL_g7933 [Triparma columacea]
MRIKLTPPHHTSTPLGQGLVLYAEDISNGYRRVYHLSTSYVDAMSTIRRNTLGTSTSTVDLPSQRYLIATVFNYSLESSWSGVYARYKVNVRDGELTYTVTKGWGDFRTLAGDEVWRLVEKDNEGGRDSGGGEVKGTPKRNSGGITGRLRTLSSGARSGGGGRSSDGVSSNPPSPSSSSTNYNSWSISSRIKHLNRVLERCCTVDPAGVRRWCEREGRRRSVLERWGDKGEWVKVDKPTGGVVVMGRGENKGRGGVQTVHEEEGGGGGGGGGEMVVNTDAVTGGLKARAMEWARGVDLLTLAFLGVVAAYDSRAAAGFVVCLVWLEVRAMWGEIGTGGKDEEEEEERNENKTRKSSVSSAPVTRRLSNAGVTPGPSPLLPPSVSMTLGSPLPTWPSSPVNCSSSPPSNLFRVRGPNYFKEKVKVPSSTALFPLRGVDLWLTDNAMSEIARHPDMLGGELGDKETLVVNFMMPWGNLVAYFDMSEYKEGESLSWDRFLVGDQAYRDKRLKLLPVVVEGPWICQRAIGPGNAPAVIGKALPVQYHRKVGKYFEVDLVVMSSSVARGILSIVKSHTKSITIDLAFIIEGAKEDELPERVMGAFRLHNLDPNRCPKLPDKVLEGSEDDFH